MSVDEHKTREEIRAEAQRVEESARYSSETQFEYAKRWRRVDRLIGGAGAVMAAVAGVGGLADLISARWAGFIAVLAAGTGAVAASLGAPQTKERAAGSANAYRALQQDSRILINIDLERLPMDDARHRLQQLVHRLQQLNAEAEVPSQRAWRNAKATVERGSQEYEVDKT